MNEFDPEVYRNAKSTRPAWANTLIVAGFILIIGVALTLMSGIGVGWWLFVATAVTLVIAGIQALMGIGTRQSKP